MSLVSLLNILIVTGIKIIEAVSGDLLDGFHVSESPCRDPFLRILRLWIGLQCAFVFSYKSIPIKVSTKPITRGE